MAKKKSKFNKRDAEWAEAKRRCRLSVEDVRMAKELGMSPRSLIKNIPSPSQKWKSSVKDWVRELYHKRRKKASDPKPGDRQPKPPRGEEPAVDAEHLVDAEQAPAPECDYFESEDVFGDFFDSGTETDVEETNQGLLRRQAEFRQAAEAVARALAELPQVNKIVLFGSVAVPLWKEVPRFREFRRSGIAVWHECKDVDLAVWVSDLNDLKSLQRARNRALAGLMEEQEIGVAHHQVELFLMEPGSDRYLGRLCLFGQCPKGKPECRVSGCGKMPFLRQHEDFVFRLESLGPERSVLLFARQAATESFD